MERLALETGKEWEAQGEAASEFAVESVESGVVAGYEAVVGPARIVVEVEARWGHNRDSTVKVGK